MLNRHLKCHSQVKRPVQLLRKGLQRHLRPQRHVRTHTGEARRELLRQKEGALSGRIAEAGSEGAEEAIWSQAACSAPWARDHHPRPFPPPRRRLVVHSEMRLKAGHWLSALGCPRNIWASGAAIGPGWRLGSGSCGPSADICASLSREVILSQNSITLVPPGAQKKKTLLRLSTLQAFCGGGEEEVSVAGQEAGLPSTAFLSAPSCPCWVCVPTISFHRQPRGTCSLVCHASDCW